MKILYVTLEVPYPPNNGVKIPLYHSMRLMREAGHELAIITLAENYESAKGEWKSFLEHFPVECAELIPLHSRSRYEVLLKSLAANRMFFLERYASSLFENELRLMVERFQPDSVHFDLITMTGYRGVIPKGVKTIASINDSYSLFTENNINYGLMGRKELFFRKFQLWQARRYEARQYATFDAVHTMTEVDAQYLKGLNPALNVVAIPNGVDESIFQVNPFEGGSERKDLIYVGSLTGKYMRWLLVFLKECWPQIASDFPNVKFILVGRYGADSVDLEALVEQSERVEHVSFVPDLMDLYSQCGVALVPIRQTCGLINKLVEAMAAGLAVFAPKVSYAGVAGAKHRENAMMFDTEADLVEGVVELLGDPSGLLGLQKNAHSFAAERYRWRTRKSAFEQLYK